MSQLPATVRSICSHEALNIVTFDFAGEELSMMSLEMQQRLRVGQRVILGVKPTAVALTKERVEQSSFVNQIRVKIISIDEGVLLGSIRLQAGATRFEAIVLRRSMQNFDLEAGDDAIAVIPASEVSILEVMDA